MASEKISLETAVSLLPKINGDEQVTKYRNNKGRRFSTHQSYNRAQQDQLLLNARTAVLREIEDRMVSIFVVT